MIVKGVQNGFSVRLAVEELINLILYRTEPESFLRGRAAASGKEPPRRAFFHHDIAPSHIREPIPKSSLRTVSLQFTRVTDRNRNAFRIPAQRGHANWEWVESHSSESRTSSSPGQTPRQHRGGEQFADQRSEKQAEETVNHG